MKTLLNNLKTVFASSPDHPVELIKIRFLVISGIIGSLLLITYAIINFAIADYPAAVMELIMGLMMLAAVIISVVTMKLGLASALGLFPVVFMTMHNFNSGGFFDTGLLWCYILPPVSIFLVGTQISTVIHVLFLLFTLLLRTLANTGQVNFLYGDFEYLMFVLTYTTVFLLTALFETAWQQSNSALIVKGLLLGEKNLELERTIDTLTKTKGELSASVGRYESANKLLTEANQKVIEREKKMVELKRKLQSN